MLKGQKGITLVALVITIIVLIILAGVSIALVLGDDGIVNKAKSGAQNYALAANEETGVLQNIFTYVNEY
ncbi:MAG: hypothetical protein GX682_03715 [Clostridiaceae bacterium]|nr:hypothetical protein [Clostridiaceae bacterium]